MGMRKTFAVFGLEFFRVSGHNKQEPFQGGHLPKADKFFCPVIVRFREVPLYNKMIYFNKNENGG